MDKFVTKELNLSRLGVDVSKMKLSTRKGE
jgi:hypothetical protein